MRALYILDVIGEYVYELSLNPPKQYVRDLSENSIGYAGTVPENADYVPNDACLSVLGLMALCPTFRSLGFEGVWTAMNPDERRKVNIVRGLIGPILHPLDRRQGNVEYEIIHPVVKLSIGDHPLAHYAAAVRLSMIVGAPYEDLARVFYKVRPPSRQDIGLTPPFRVDREHDMLEVLEELSKLIDGIKRPGLYYVPHV